MREAQRIMGYLSLVFAVLVLTACVTTTDAPKKQPVDKRSALENYIQLGMTYLNKGNRDGAIGAFTKAIALDKKSAEAHQGLAMVHQINGENELAEKSFKKALKGRADFSMSGIKNSYGRFLFEEGRVEEALPYFEEAGRDLQYRGRANSMLMVGRSALLLGDTARARGAFEYALNLNPRLALASLELADMFFQDRNYAEAKKYLDQFANNARHTPRSLWLGIRIERIFGNKDKEASYVLSLKNLHPYSQEYLDYKRYIEVQEQ